VHTLIILCVVLGSAPIYGQDEPQPLVAGEWRREGKVGLNLLQSYYTKNWEGGDKGSVVWAANFDYRAEAQLNEKWNWRNDLNLAFGQTHQQQRDADGALIWQKPDKTTDLIKFETLLRYSLQGFDPYFAFRFESQFLDQLDPRGDITFNPMTFSESVGISRQLVNQGDRTLLSRLGFALRQNSRKFFSEAPPSDDTERLSSNDGGLELVLDYADKILSDRVAYTSKFTAYKPVYYSAKSDFDDLAAADLIEDGLPDDIADYGLAVDLDWENTFVTAITRLINVQFYLRWSYDKYDNSAAPKLDVDGGLDNPGVVGAAIRKAGQLKQTMAIGLAYTF
jgi:hypothetical protein